MVYICLYSLGPLFAGFLGIRALLFGVYTRVPDPWKLPYTTWHLKYKPCFLESSLSWAWDVGSLCSRGSWSPSWPQPRSFSRLFIRRCMYLLIGAYGHLLPAKNVFPHNTSPWRPTSRFRLHDGSSRSLHS